MHYSKEHLGETTAKPLPSTRDLGWFVFAQEQEATGVLNPWRNLLVLQGGSSCSPGHPALTSTDNHTGLHWI